MNELLRGGAAILLAALLADEPALAIELPSASNTVVSPVAVRPEGLSYSVSGVISAIDTKRGTLTLDGSQRYAFVAKTLAVRRQNDVSRPASIAEISVGSRVSLTMQRKSTTAPATVSEVWIAP